MIRTLARWAGRAALGTLAAALLAAAVLHTPPGRNLLRHLLLGLLRRGGIEARLGTLQVAPLRLEATVSGLELRVPGAPPFLSLARARARFPAAVLTGRPGLRELEADGLELNLERGKDGFNLPSAEGGGGTADLDLRPWLSARVEVREATVRLSDAASDAEAVAERLRLEWSGHAGTIVAPGGIAWRMGERRGRVEVQPIRADSDGSRLRVEAPELRGPEGALALSAALAPLAGRIGLTSTVTGRAELASLLGPPWAGALIVKAGARGALGAPEADLDVSATGLAYGALVLTGSAHAETRGETVHASLSLAAAGGTLAAEADLGPHEGRATARGSGFELASLLGGGAPLSARLGGGLRARWPAGEPLQGDLDAEVALGETDGPKAGAALAAGGRSVLTVRGGRYDLVLDHSLGEATRIQGHLEGKLDPRGLERTDVRGRIGVHMAAAQEVARALGHEGPSVRGRVEADLTLSGVVATPVAEGSLVARDLGLGHSPSLEADARVRATLRTVRADLLAIRGGGASASGQLEVDDAGRLTGGFVGDVPDLAVWATALPAGWAPEGAAHVEGQVEGTVARPVLSLDLDGRGVALLGQPRFETLRARLQASTGGVQLEELTLDQGEGRLQLAGSLAGSRRELRLDARRFAIHPVKAGVLSEADLPVRGTLQGTIGLQIDGDRAEGGGRLELLDVELRARGLGAMVIDLRGEQGALAAEAHWPSLGAEGRARVGVVAPHPVTASLGLARTDLAALARAAGLSEGILAGTASLEAAYEAEGPRLGAGAMAVELTALEGTARQLPFRLSAPARLRADPGGASVVGLRMDVAGGNLTADGTLAGPGSSIGARYQGPLQGLGPLLTPSDAAEAAVRLDGEMDLALELHGPKAEPRLEGRLRLASGAATRGEAPLLSELALEASLAEGVLEIARLAGTSHDVRFEGRGRAGAALLPGMPTALRALLGGDARASASLRLEGEPGSEREGLRVEAEMAADGPTLADVQATARIEGLSFEVQQVPLRQNEPVTVELHEGRLRVPTAVWRGGRNDLRIGGLLRLPDPGRPLAEARLDAAAEGELDLRLLNALGRGLEAGGGARLKATISGAVQSPDIEGELQLSGAVVRYRPLRVALDDVNATLRASAGQVILESLTGTLNGGSLQGGGRLGLAKLAPTSGSLGLEVRGAALDWPRGLRGTADADLELRGSASGPVLGGTVTVSGVHYNGDPTKLKLGSGPRLRPAEKGPARTALGLDLRLRSLDDVRVDNPFGVFGFSLDVKAQGTAEHPRLAGRIELAPGGYVYWSGRRFTLERGRLDWNASSGLWPFVQARALTRVGSYGVTADFSGPVDRAEARLASDPPLSTNEITSLLVTGSTQAGATDSRALGIVSANFLGNMGKVAGLDSVRLDTGEDQGLLDFDPGRATSETNPAQRLTITKRLASNLEVTVSLNLSESGKTTTFVSWKPRPPFELRVAQRDDYTGSLEFRHDVAFGGAAPPPPPPKDRRPRGHGRETVGTVQVEDDGGESRAVELRLRAGQTFDYETWQSDRRRLEAAASRQGFAEAYVLARREPRVASPEGGRVDLTYVVRRGPRTTVQVSGLPLEPDAVREIRVAWARGDYAGSMEEEALSRTRAALARAGYFTPRLKIRLETSPDGARKGLLLTGEPGEKAASRRVEWRGVSALPRERLDALVKGKDLLAQAWSDPHSLERAVADLYRREGYLAAAATARPATIQNAEAVLPIEVEEGPLFTRGDARVEGCAGLPCAEAQLALGLPEGAPYREAETDAARERLLAAYRARGFAAARVEIEGTIDVAAARVDLRTSVEEGPRQVLGELLVEGGDAATRRALVPLVKLAPGQPVVAEEWAAARKRVYETGLVRGVNLDPVPGPAPVAEAAPGDGPGPSAPTETVDARLTLEEWPALRVRYGLQLVTEEPLSEGGTNTVDLGGILELSRATLFRRAISSALAAEARPDTWSVRGAFSAPRTFGRPLRSSLYMVREREEVDLSVVQGGGTLRADGDSLELTLEERLQLSRKLGLALAYNVQWLDLTFPELKLAPLSFRPARLIATGVVDGRNGILDPTNGFFSSVSANYGAEFLGSEFDFTRTFLQQYLYLPLGRGFLSASGARYERGSGNQAFLTTERLPLGGPTTVRGYDRENVDIIDLVALQGITTHVLVLNQELRFPIWSDLRGVAFLDYGQFWSGLEGARATFWRLGTGLGLRYSTPVGVLRFDVGYALKDGDRRPRYYVGLGQAF